MSNRSSSPLAAFFGLKSPFCGPSDKNGAASAVTAPAVPSPGVRILKKSNLDLNGRLVKRGCVVSWHGFRGPVARVRGGYLYPVAGSSLFVNVGAWVACESVQVVE